MRISTGIAELHLASAQSGRVKAEKAYLWPVYDAGKITNIHGVTKRTDSNSVYSKPLPEEHIRLLQELHNSPIAEYTPRGLASERRSVSYQPGTFFDALA